MQELDDRRPQLALNAIAYHGSFAYLLTHRNANPGRLVKWDSTTNRL